MSRDKKKRARLSGVNSPALANDMLVRMRPARERMPDIVAASRRRASIADRERKKSR
jgi:hypothetical protein